MLDNRANFHLHKNIFWLSPLFSNTSDKIESHCTKFDWRKIRVIQIDLTEKTCQWYIYCIIGSVHVYHYSTKSGNSEIEKTVFKNSLKNIGSNRKSNDEKDDVSVKDRYTENKDLTVKTQTFELETVLSPTKTTPYSCFGHTHHVTGTYSRHYWYS